MGLDRRKGESVLDNGEEKAVAKTPEQIHEEELKRLQEFKPIHDTFARLLFRDNLPLAQDVLRTITGIKDLVLTHEETQYDLKRLAGSRSLMLDVYGGDSAGRKYNLELERSDERATPERAEYHITGMNSEHLKQGMDFSELPETYVIFLTEEDAIGDGKAVHRFSYRDDDTNDSMGGRTHIIYANGAYEGDDEIGKLMHDFRCVNADDMYNKLMAEKTKYLKDDPKGVKEMCAIMEDLRKESEERGKEQGKYENAVKVVKNMLSMGLGSYEDIAKVTDLSIEKVRELAGQRTA